MEVVLIPLWLYVSLASYIMDGDTRLGWMYCTWVSAGTKWTSEAQLEIFASSRLIRVYSNHHPTGILGFCWIPFERELPAERRASYRVLAGIPRAVHHEHVRSGWLVVRRGD